MTTASDWYGKGYDLYYGEDNVDEAYEMYKKAIETDP
jgi:tetratricopeptide (TPR) repeat protein